MARFLVMLLASVPFLAQAQIVGDPEAGEGKAAVCASCHGMDGNSQVSMWPKLAEQHAGYAARQSRLIRDQEREAPQMYPIVQGMSDQDLADIAAYYETLPIKPGVADEALVDAGEALYHAGNPESGVPSCAGCHGPSGSGIKGAYYPRLGGQHADYTANRLRAYRNGVTNGEDDPFSKIMAGVAENLTDEEIEAVSSYIEGLHTARW